jgi:hypothetical protein
MAAIAFRPDEDDLNMKDLRRCVGIGSLILTGSLVGCGADGGGAVGTGGVMPAPQGCGTVDPCEGDLTGTWKVLGGCLTPAEFDDPACTQATFQLTTLSYAGTMTFNPDMSYTATDFVENRAEIDTIPTTCLGAPVQTCAEEDTSLKSQVNTLSGTGFSSAGCTGSSTCTCSIAEADKVIGDSGTYVLDGNSLNFNSDIGEFEGFSYCVQNGLLHLMTVAITEDSTGAETMTVASDIVAQLQ